MRKNILYLVLAFTVSSLIACSDDDKNGYTPEVIANPVTGLSITNVTASEGIVLPDVGAKEKVNVTLSPADAGDAERYFFDYSSSNPSVFTISTNGEITAMGAGEATLQVTAKNNADMKTSCKVTVVGIQITHIEFDEEAYTFAHSANAWMDLSNHIKVMPENASVKTLKYTSSDLAVASIDMYGFVRPIWGGTTRITATALDGSNKSASCDFTVTIIPIASISFNSFTLNLQSNAIVAGSTSGTIHVNNLRNLLSSTECNPNITIGKTTSSSSNYIRYGPNNASRTILNYSASESTIVDVAADASNKLIVKPQSKAGTSVISIDATDEMGAHAELTVVNHAVYQRSEWKIVAHSQDGKNPQGDGGAIENVISDDNVSAGLVKADKYNANPQGIDEAYFVVDLGKNLPFDYMLTEVIYTNADQTGSRIRQVSLYGSNEFPSESWTPIQENINVNHSSYYIVPTKLDQSSNYRYVKVVVWSTSAGNQYPYYIIKNFWLGSAE